MQQSSSSPGFILPIVLLMLTGLGLAWSALPPLDRAAMRQTEQLQLIQQEVLFWHRAMIAYEFAQNGVVHRFDFAIEFYDLEWPSPMLTETGESVEFASSYTIGGDMVANISGLPEELRNNYLEHLPDGVSVDYFDRLTMQVRPIEEWDFTKSLIRKANLRPTDIHTDLDLNSHDVLHTKTLLANVRVPQASFTFGNRLIQAEAMQVGADRLNLERAFVGAVDLQQLVIEFSQLETAMLACLQPSGPC